MSEHPFDTITRTVGADRRRTVLALGAAGLAAAVAGPLGAPAGTSAGKKAKKKCKKQKASCLNQVTTFCSQLGDGAPQCQAAAEPCCASCNVGTAVVCALTALPSS